MAGTELKPCPFCWGEAIMTIGELPARYTNRENEIPADARISMVRKLPKGKTVYVYRKKAYIPQCADTSCLGRVYKRFETEAAATEAWNKRADDRKAENL